MRIRKKYDQETKLRCIEAVLKEQRSILSVSEETGINTTQLRLWVSFYEVYGISSIHFKGKQKFDQKFKLKVLQTIADDRLSLREACIRFSIRSESTIINWQRIVATEGEQGLLPKRKGRPIKMNKPIKRKKKQSSKPLTREEELLKENEFLRAQNELLKKLQALVQTDRKQKP